MFATFLRVEAATIFAECGNRSEAIRKEAAVGNHTWSGHFSVIALCNVASSVIGCVFWGMMPGTRSLYHAKVVQHVLQGLPALCIMWSQCSLYDYNQDLCTNQITLCHCWLPTLSGRVLNVCMERNHTNPNTPRTIQC